MITKRRRNSIKTLKSNDWKLTKFYIGGLFPIYDS
jgi:hypothetical protein